MTKIRYSNISRFWVSGILILTVVGVEFFILTFTLGVIMFNVKLGIYIVNTNNTQVHYSDVCIGQILRPSWVIFKKFKKISCLKQSMLWLGRLFVVAGASDSKKTRTILLLLKQTVLCTVLVFEWSV